jgi:hypothetical protein
MKKNKKNSGGGEDIQGFKYFKVLAKLTEHLREAYRDPKHPNKRVLHYDQYIALILVYLFNPACDSLRKIQELTELDNFKSFSAANVLAALRSPTQHKCSTPNSSRASSASWRTRFPTGPWRR